MNSDTRSTVIKINNLLRLGELPLYQIIIIGFVLRLIWSLAANPVPLADFAFYFEHAGAMASGLGYAHADGTPTAYWPVGYPAFLSFIFYLFGQAAIWGRLANVVLSVLTIGIFYLITKKLTEDEWIRRLSVFILAIYPNQIFYTSLLSDSILFQFLMFTGIYLLIAGNSKNNFLYISVSGVLWAAAVYTRPYALLLPLLILFYNFLKERKPVTILKKAAILYTIILLAIAPWIYRNYNIFGRFVFISANSGINLYIGNNPGANGTYKENVNDNNAGAIRLTEVEADSFAFKKGLEYIAEHPFQFIKIIPAKLFWMYADDTDGFRYNLQGMDLKLGSSALHPTFTGLDLIFKKYSIPQLATIGILQLFYWLVLAIAAFYMLLIIRKKSEKQLDTLVILIIFYFTLISIIFFGTSRYHFPLIPFFILFAVKSIRYFLVNNTYQNIQGHNNLKI